MIVDWPGASCTGPFILFILFLFQITTDLGHTQPQSEQSRMITSCLGRSDALL